MDIIDLKNPEAIAKVLYKKSPETFEDRVDGVRTMPWEQAKTDRPEKVAELLEEASLISMSPHGHSKLIESLGEGYLKNLFADFMWCWGRDWFVETEVGNFHWKDPDYGGDNTFTLFDGDSKKFCEHLNIQFGRDKGRHFVAKKIGEFTLRIPELETTKAQGE